MLGSVLRQGESVLPAISLLLAPSLLVRALLRLPSALTVHMGSRQRTGRLLKHRLLLFQLLSERLLYDHFVLLDWCVPCHVVHGEELVAFAVLHNYPHDLAVKD